MNRFTLIWMRHGKLNELNFFTIEEAQQIKLFLQAEYGIPEQEMSIIENATYEQAIHVSNLQLGDIL